MSAAYFHCHSGISGDMILGALLDLGVPLEELREALAGLRLQGYQLRSRKVKRGQLGCTQVLVDAKPPPSRKGARHAHAHVHRNLQDIQKLIRESGLPTVVQTHALAIFEEIAKAEAKVHRTRKDRIHFHEVGAVDSIVDIVGGAWALHRLNISRVLASPLNTGQGTIECEHGLLPVPAPATLELLRGIPCYS
ncbi:MAG: LarC family nickel insertion protein, partial [Nitrospinaceae bacterium]